MSEVLRRRKDAGFAKMFQTCLNRRLDSRGSPAPTQVQQMTSALCVISLSVALLSALYFFSSALESSPADEKGVVGINV